MHVIRAPSQFFAINTAANAINTNAYVELDSAVNENTKGVQVNNASTSTLKLAMGAASSEADILVIPPSSVGPLLPVDISKGARLSICAVSANASSGYVTVNLFR